MFDIVSCYVPFTISLLSISLWFIWRSNVWLVLWPVLCVHTIQLCVLYVVHLQVLTRLTWHTKVYEFLTVRLQQALCQAVTHQESRFMEQVRSVLVVTSVLLCLWMIDTHRPAALSYYHYHHHHHYHHCQHSFTCPCSAFVRFVTWPCCEIPDPRILFCPDTEILKTPMSTALEVTVSDLHDMTCTQCINKTGKMEVDSL